MERSLKCKGKVRMRDDDLGLVTIEITDKRSTRNRCREVTWGKCRKGKKRLRALSREYQHLRNEEENNNNNKMAAENDNPKERKELEENLKKGNRQ